MIELKIKIGNTFFQNPVFVASGTFGYGLEAVKIGLDLSGFGGIVSKSITRYPREGNPPPRLVETASGMINSIGLANVGVEKFVSDILPEMEKLGTPVIVNIAGTDREEYIQVLEMIESVNPDIAGYEINISCPNVKQGGMEFGVDPVMTGQLTADLRKRTNKLLIMKLSPNVTSIAEIAQAAEAEGADALSAINTVVGMSIDSTTRKSNIYTYYGGLSGPAIKPVGLACVNKVYNSVKIPVIGIGGITNGADMAEYFIAGAVAVQVGTANFRDPGIALKIVQEFSDYCEGQKLISCMELTGTLLKNKPT